VLVLSITRNPSRLSDLRPPEGVNAAVEMHVKVWPVAKRYAAETVQECLLGREGWAGRVEVTTPG